MGLFTGKRKKRSCLLFIPGGLSVAVGVAAGIADVAIYYLVQLKFAVILDPLSSDPADDYYKPVRRQHCVSSLWR